MQNIIINIYIKYQYNTRVSRECVCVLWLLNHLCTSTAKPQPQSNRSDHFICLLFDHPLFSPIPKQKHKFQRQFSVVPYVAENYIITICRAEKQKPKHCRTRGLHNYNLSIKLNGEWKKKRNCIFDLMTIIFAKLARGGFFLYSTVLFHALTMRSNLKAKPHHRSHPHQFSVMFCSLGILGWNACTQLWR